MRAAAPPHMMTVCVYASGPQTALVREVVAQAAESQPECAGRVSVREREGARAGIHPSGQQQQQQPTGADADAASAALERQALSAYKEKYSKSGAPGAHEANAALFASWMEEAKRELLGSMQTAEAQGQLARKLAETAALARFALSEGLREIESAERHKYENMSARCQRQWYEVIASAKTLQRSTSQAAKWQSVLSRTQRLVKQSRPFLSAEQMDSAFPDYQEMTRRPGSAGTLALAAPDRAADGGSDVVRRPADVSVGALVMQLAKPQLEQGQQLAAASAASRGEQDVVMFTLGLETHSMCMVLASVIARVQRAKQYIAASRDVATLTGAAASGSGHRIRQTAREVQSQMQEALGSFRQFASARRALAALDDALRAVLEGDGPVPSSAIEAAGRALRDIEQLLSAYALNATRYAGQCGLDVERSQLDRLKAAPVQALRERAQSGALAIEGDIQALENVALKARQLVTQSSGLDERVAEMQRAVFALLASSSVVKSRNLSTMLRGITVDGALDRKRLDSYMEYVDSLLSDAKALQKRLAASSARAARADVYSMSDPALIRNFAVVGVMNPLALVSSSIPAQDKLKRVRTLRESLKLNARNALMRSMFSASQAVTSAAGDPDIDDEDKRTIVEAAALAIPEEESDKRYEFIEQYKRNWTLAYRTVKGAVDDARNYLNALEADLSDAR